jgi:hypothetical protein
MGRCEGCCVTRTAIAACPRSRAGLPVPETRRSLAAPAAARDCAGRLWPVERPCGALAVSVARLRGNRLRRYSPSSDSSWEPSSSPLSRPSPRFQARRAGAADSRSRTLLLRSGRIESILARAPDRLDQVPLAHPRSSGDVLSLGDLVELLAVSILQLARRHGPPAAAGLMPSLSRPARRVSGYPGSGSTGASHRRVAGASRMRMMRAGAPATTALAGTSWVTTALAPMIELSPTRTPRRTHAL